MSRPPIWGLVSRSASLAQQPSCNRRSAFTQGLHVGYGPFPAFVCAGCAMQRVLGILAVYVGNESTADPGFRRIRLAICSKRAFDPGIGVNPMHNRAITLGIEGGSQRPTRPLPILPDKEAGKLLIRNRAGLVFRMACRRERSDRHGDRACSETERRKTGKDRRRDTISCSRAGLYSVALFKSMSTMGRQERHPSELGHP
jgi:hypothetical protein